MKDHLCSEFSPIIQSNEEYKLPLQKNRKEMLPKIRDLLIKCDFGRETEFDNDPVFFNTVSDSHRVLKTIIEAGRENDSQRKENTILFKKPVYFSITDSSYLQATAIALGDCDMVFITEGFINRIRRSICKLLSHSDTFKTIGSPGDKEKHRQADGDETLLPLCPKRREFANGTIQRALEYVFVHELAHLFYGHHAYLEEIDNSAYQYPFLMTEPRDKSLLTRRRYDFEIQSKRHAMEIQADRYAGDVTVMLALKETFGQISNFGAPSEKTLKELEKQALQELGTAITVIFNIVESINRKYHTHPYPKYRQLATTMSIHTVLLSTFRENAKDILTNPNEALDILNNISKQTNEAWLHTSMTSIDSDKTLSEEEYRNLLDQAMLLFPKLDSRFDRYHVI